MNAVQDQRLATARLWMTEDIAAVFDAEIANERNGGITPATLSSTIDSITQGLPVAEGGDPAGALVGLLMIRDLLPGDTEVRDLF